MRGKQALSRIAEAEIRENMALAASKAVLGDGEAERAK